MRAIFIRHKLGSTPAILEDLWSKRRIAVRYANIRSANPDDYENPGRNALKRLWKYCDSSAIVGATFRKIRPTQMVVGVIEKGSRVEWTDEYGDDFIYKVVQLKNTQVISYYDYPLLAAIQPRLATVTGWPSAQKYLQAILDNERIPLDVKSLAPSQLEVICYEFLRMKGTIKALLLPIGRALPDVDIYGVGNEGEIIAQVTHSTNHAKVKSKLNQLREYESTSTNLIFFGPEHCRIDDSAVQYIAIEEVFDSLFSAGDETVYPRLIARMLGWEKAG